MRKTYAVSHWALTLILAPLASQLIGYIFGKNRHEVVGLLEIYPASLLFSILFSLPTFLIYGACFYFLSKYNISIAVSKFVLILISILGIFITLEIMGGTLASDIAIAYSVTSIIIGLFLQLKKVPKTQADRIVV